MSHPVRVSDDFSVPIPPDVRQQAGIEQGQRLVAIPRGRGVLFLPEENIGALRGVLRGADTSGYRDRRPDGD